MVWGEFSDFFFFLVKLKDFCEEMAFCLRFRLPHPTVSWASWICVSHFIAEAKWKCVSAHLVFVMLMKTCLLLNKSWVSTSLKGFHQEINIVGFYPRRPRAFSGFLAASRPVGAPARATLMLSPIWYDFLQYFFLVLELHFTRHNVRACSPSSGASPPCQQIWLR